MVALFIVLSLWPVMWEAAPVFDAVLRQTNDAILRQANDAVLRQANDAILRQATDASCATAGHYGLCYLLPILFTGSGSIFCERIGVSRDIIHGTRSWDTVIRYLTSRQIADIGAWAVADDDLKVKVRREIYLHVLNHFMFPWNFMESYVKIPYLHDDPA